MISTDLETWLLDYEDRIYRLLEYRRVGDWTPLEMEKKYIDQSQYVDSTYQLIRIKEVIELPDKDVLIGYIDIENYESGIIKYKRLSQIELSYFPQDNEYLDE